MDLKGLNYHLKRYDRELVCEKNRDGIPLVLRKYKTYVPVQVDDLTFYNLITDKQYVFAITDNWLTTGKPCDWGIDHVLNALRERDLHENERLLENMEANNKRQDELTDRRFRNEVKAFASDVFRPYVKEATKDILTHSVSMDEPKKRLKDRSIKNGNR